MNAKFSLALVALVSIGLFALPSTVALFSGQHSFYNIDATGNQVPCIKCHGDVKAELMNGASNTTGTPGPHAAFKCEYCHRIEQGSSSGDDAYARLAYKQNETGNNATRYLVTTVMDMEAGNVPATITVNDTVTTAKTRPAVNGAPNSTFKGVLSACIVAKGTAAAGACDDNTTVLTIAAPDMRIVGAYYANNATPKDSNASTASTGLDVSKINFNVSGSTSAGWTVTDLLTNAGSRAVNPGSTYHAASLVSCMECHGGDEPMGHYTRVINGETDIVTPCANCHYGGSPNGTKMTTLWAGGFGLTGKPFDTGTSEAHNAWVKTNDTISRFAGPNGNASNNACIACHTHVAVQINFKKGYLLQFNATEDDQGNYTVGAFYVKGSVNVTTYGNSSGNAFAVSNTTYDWYPNSTTLYINGTNVSVIGLRQATNDSEAALI